VYVDLGTSTAYGRSFSYPIDGTADASQVDQDWSGLAPRTRYHWRLRFVESNGVTVLGADQTFTTVATVAVKVPPSVSTGSPSAVAQTTATLTGTVNPNGFAVTGCRFDYGTTSAYGASVPCAQIAGGGTSAVAVSASPSGLLAGTTYHYRLVATNAGGTTAGTDMTFATRSGGGCHGCGNPKPCAGLASAQLENCNAAVAYRSALATCDRKYHGKSRAAKAKHAACRKRATTTYHRALALIKCSKIRNKHKRLLCTKHARRVQ
jgi:hypothetical protein